MKRTILSLLVMLMCTAGAWAEGDGTKENPYTGEVSPAAIKAGDYLSQDCAIKSSGDLVEIVDIYDTKVSRNVLSTTLSQMSAKIDNCLNNDSYDSTLKLFTAPISNRLFVVTECSNSRYSGATTYTIKGYFEGFYSKDEVLADIDRIGNHANTVEGHDISNSVNYYKTKINGLQDKDVASAYNEFVQTYDNMKKFEADLRTWDDDSYDSRFREIVNRHIPLLYQAENMAALNTCYNSCFEEINEIVYREDAVAEMNEVVGSRTDQVLLEMRNEYASRIMSEPMLAQVDKILRLALAELQLKCAKVDAIQEIDAALSDDADDYQMTVAQNYKNSIDAAYSADKVDAVKADALSAIAAIRNEPSAVRINFKEVEGMPIVKEHILEDTELSFSDNGEQIYLNINDASVIYNIADVSSISHFNGIPTVSLHANQDPDNAGKFYTTFYSGLQAYAIPDGVKAYIAKPEEREQETVAMMTAIEGKVIPRNVAVLLYSNVSGEMRMEVTTDVNMDVDDNQLHGVDVQTAQTDAYQYYMLSYGQLKLGFYKMGEEMSLSANKAFLTMPMAVPTMAFRFVLDDEADVNGIDIISDASSASSGKQSIYSISGVRQSKFQKGINIVDGRKIVVE